MTLPMPLDDLAGRINAEHAACVEAARSAVDHAIQAGKLLLDAKATLGHGRFLPWVGNNCSFGERQAQRYMKVARWRELNPTRETDLLSLRDVMAEVTTPKAEEPEPEPARMTLAEAEATIEAAGEQVRQAGYEVNRLIRGLGPVEARSLLQAQFPDNWPRLLAVAQAAAEDATAQTIIGLAHSLEELIAMGEGAEPAPPPAWQERYDLLPLATARPDDWARLSDEVRAGMAGTLMAVERDTGVGRTDLMVTPTRDGLWTHTKAHPGTPDYATPAEAAAALLDKYPTTTETAEAKAKERQRKRKQPN